MKKIVFFGLLISIASITFAQLQMQVWQDGVPTSFAVEEVDSITFKNENYNIPLIGDWQYIYNKNVIYTFSDSLITNNLWNIVEKYTASSHQLHLERLWVLENDSTTRWTNCNYSLNGDTLSIDSFWIGTIWLNQYPPVFKDITLIKVKK